MNRLDEGYCHRARAAILAAAEAKHAFAGWLGAILVSVADQLSSTDALTAGRPRSRETQLVRQLTKGTADWTDDFLGDYKGPFP